MFQEAAFPDFLVRSAESTLVSLHSGISHTDAAHVPNGLRHVARQTAGFVHNSKRRKKWVQWDGEIRWDGETGSDYLQDADSNLWHMDVGQDVCGNRWVLLLEPKSGSPNQVLWASHERPLHWWPRIPSTTFAEES